MAKNIIFCADGTWNGNDQDANGDEAPNATNVLKLFAHLAGQTTPESLRLQDEQEKVLTDASGANAVQVAKYLHGVGDSNNAIIKILGGVFGAGFIERVVRGYTFVSRNYQPGDRIYLVGFSRGAYTARALGGMILKMGLLPAASMLASDGSYDADGSYRRGISVWTQYRVLAGKMSRLLGYLDDFSATHVKVADLVQPSGIEAIGVWDTVGSLGFPIIDPANRDRLDVFKFADNDLSPRVGSGFHAVSIDEERGDFLPTLWNPRDQVKQVLFVGAHADVGGGYPAWALSNLSLAWMVKNLTAVGMLFPPGVAIPVDNPPIPYNTPWTIDPFRLLPHAPRVHPPGSLFHSSVQQRLDVDATYVPPSLASFLQGRKLPTPQIVD